MCLVYAACVVVCSVVPSVWSLFVAEPDVDVVSYVSGDRALILLTPVPTPPDHCPVRGHLPRQLSISKYSCLNVHPSVRPSGQYPPHPITAQYAVTSLASYPSVSTVVSMSVCPSVWSVPTPPDHCPVRGHLPRQLSIGKYSCLNVRLSVRPSGQYPPHPITAQYAVTSLASYPSVSTAVSMSIRPSVRLVSTHPTRSLPSTRSPPSPAIHQ